MAKTPSPRLDALYEELQRTLAEYRASKTAFLDARVRFEAAGKRFAGMSDLAADMLSRGSWFEWRDKHPDVTYLGMALGDAISQVLDSKATRAAEQTAYTDLDPTSKPKDFMPWMRIEEIVTELERGGFEFRSLTPLREVNAALMKLEGVEKRAGLYKTKRADAILDKMTGWVIDDALDKGKEEIAGNKAPLFEESAETEP